MTTVTVPVPTNETTEDEFSGGMTLEQNIVFNFLKKSLELLHSSQHHKQRIYTVSEHDLVPYEMYRN